MPKLKTFVKPLKKKTMKKKSTKTIKQYKSCGNKDMKCQQKLVLELLIDCDFPKNTSRKNVMRTGQNSYEGFVLGKINLIAHMWKKTKKKVNGKYVTTIKKQQQSNRTKDPKFKRLYRETRKMMNMHDPNFKYTTIQYNKDQQTAKHKDGRNVGVSYIIGLGKYTDGEVIVYDINNKNPKHHDIHNKFLSFNGSDLYHETAPFKGNRYTMVFFNV